MNERGQLILIAGLVVSISIIGLVLILNGVLFTENISTREEPQEVDRSIEIVTTYEQNTIEILDRLNSRLEAESGKTNERVERDLGKIAEGIRAQNFESHNMIFEEEIETEQGWVITQRETSTFESRSTENIDRQSDWAMAELDGIRVFGMDIDHVDSLNITEDSASDAYRLIIASDESDVYNVYIYEDEETGDIMFSEDTDIANPTCSVSGGNANVDLISGEVNGQDCGITFGEGLDGNAPYRVAMENGDRIEGTYEILGKQGELIRFIDIGFIQSEETVRIADESGSGEEGEDENPDIVVDIVETNSPITEGDDLFVKVEAENVGEEDGTETIDLAIDGTPIGSEDVSLISGESTEVDFIWDETDGEGNDDEPRDITATGQTYGSSDTEVVYIQETDNTDPVFDVDITNTNSPVPAGDTMTVTFDVENTGGDGQQTLLLRDGDNTVLDSTQMTISGGQTETETLVWDTENPDDRGDHTLTVEPDDGNSDSVSVTVENPGGGNSLEPVYQPMTGVQVGDSSTSTDEIEQNSIKQPSNEIRYNTEEPGEPEEPTAYDATYAVELTLNIDGVDTHLETEIYIAPREPDETRSTTSPDED